MNKYTKAFNNILEHIDYSDYSENEYIKIDEAIDFFYDLIGKQDSVSVEILNGIDHLGICPICESYVQYGDNYCPNCGQKLKWKEVQKDETAE